MAAEPTDDLGVLAPIDAMMHPYREEVATLEKLPVKGRPRHEVLSELTLLRSLEDARWKDGFASGAVYHGGDEHVEFLLKAYAIHSQVNPLHSDL